MEESADVSARSKETTGSREVLARTAHQPVEAMRGEVEFRRKLVEQQTGGPVRVGDELDADALREVLAQRMAATEREMKALAAADVRLGPYLELGAERCQRALVMENDLGARGAAVDLSFHMLRSATFYARSFGKEHLPERVCCDAHLLPFASSSLPFVFCYEFLHHFPEPGPVVREIYRVMAPAGFFSFGEEPYRNRLHWNLYAGRKIYSREALERPRLRRALDHFFMTPVCNETEHGIIENHRIPVRVWKRAFSVFSECRLRLTSLGLLEVDLGDWKRFYALLPALLLGGTIGGLCRKAGERPVGGEPIERCFICPDCLLAGGEVPLQPANGGLSCPGCARRHPRIEGVQMLLCREKAAALYGDVDYRDLRER